MEERQYVLRTFNLPELWGKKEGGGDPNPGSFHRNGCLVKPVGIDFVGAPFIYALGFFFLVWCLLIICML